MKSAYLYLGAGLVLASVTAVALARPTTAAEDESANVRKQCAAFVSAWNQHDAKGMAAIFADDGDSIDPMGKLSTGRAQVEKAFAADHAGVMKNSRLRINDEPLRLITPDVAITDGDATITGVIGPDGKEGPPLDVVCTNVWRKKDGTWYIVASRPHLKAQTPPPSVSTSNPK